VKGVKPRAREVISAPLPMQAIYRLPSLHSLGSFVFTCVSYAEARNRYRLDVCLFVRPSVCLSVCLSVTRWYCIKTAEHIVMLSSPHDSPFILVLCVSTE